MIPTPARLDELEKLCEKAVWNNLSARALALPELIAAVREQQKEIERLKHAHDGFTARLNRAVDACKLDAVAEIVAEMELF